MILQGVNRRPSEGNPLFLIAFGHDAQELLVTVVVLEIERNQRADAHPGRVEDLENGLISKGEFCPIQKEVHFLRWEEAWLTDRLFEALDARRRIFPDHLLCGAEFEKPFDRRKLAVDRPGIESFSGHFRDEPFNLERGDRGHLDVRQVLLGIEFNFSGNRSEELMEVSPIAETVCLLAPLEPTRC